MRRNLFDDLAVLFFRFIGDYFRVRAGEVSNSIQKKQNNIVAIVNRFLENLYICCGRYIVNAKSMLGVLSMPEFDKGELHIHTDNEKECEKILLQLLEADLLMDTNDSVKHSIYDITTFGEMFWENGVKFFTIEGPNKEKVEFSQYL